MTPREAAVDIWRDDECMRFHVNAAIDTYEASMKSIIDNVYDDAPSYPYDGGGTTDGWQMACQRILTLMQSAP